jgi:Ca2+-transporting ATPase
VPFLRDLFRFAVLHPDDVGICLAAGVFSLLWFEGLKLIWRHHTAVPRQS